MSQLEIPTLSGRISTQRDPTRYLNDIWHTCFADVPRVNRVEIAYCQPWKRRLGLIRLSLDNATSFIGLNALLQLPRVPEYILITTIAHELTHYAHGFGSPLPRLHEHPHANNVVKRELHRRGLGATLNLCDEWIDREWFAFYDTERQAGWVNLPVTQRSARRPRQNQP